MLMKLDLPSTTLHPKYGGKQDRTLFVLLQVNQLLQVIAVGNAIGEILPPYIIYKGNRLTEELTSIFFLQHVPTRPCILLYDGHATHVTADVIKKKLGKAMSICLCFRPKQAIYCSPLMFQHSVPLKRPSHLNVISLFMKTQTVPSPETAYLC